MNIEVLDRAKISQVKPAIIKEVIGHRLRLSYLDSEDSDDKQSKSSEVSMFNYLLRFSCLKLARIGVR